MPSPFTSPACQVGVVELHKGSHRVEPVHSPIPFHSIPSHSSEPTRSIHATTIQSTPIHPCPPRIHLSAYAYPYPRLPVPIHLCIHTCPRLPHTYLHNIINTLFLSLLLSFFPVPFRSNQPRVASFWCIQPRINHTNHTNHISPVPVSSVPFQPAQSRRFTYHTPVSEK